MGARAINIVWALIAPILFVLLLSFQIVYFPIELLKRKRGAWKHILARAGEFAYALDVFGAAVGKDVLNAFCIKTGGYTFGKKGETISKALGKNKLRGTDTKFGAGFSRFLNWVDKNHVEKAANGNGDI